MRILRLCWYLENDRLVSEWRLLNDDVVPSTTPAVRPAA